MVNKKYIPAIGIITIILVLFFLGEVLSFVAFKYYIIPKDSSSFYWPPELNKAKYERYIDQRDPVLGWPSFAQLATGSFDSAGARLSPAFPKPGNECIALYGDSFTYGEEVGHAQAWGNVLSEMVSCRIANYGVGGYGTDQALLRFLNHKNDTSKIAILGIYPHNIMRNVNQLRFFLTGGSVLSQKPRFILENNALRLIEIPKFTFEEFALSIEHPSEFYRHETFLVGAVEGPIHFSFPYSLTLVKYLLSERVRNWLAGRPSWIGFYMDTHRSNALQITTKITEKFRDEAHTRNKSTLVLFYPTPASVKFYQDTGKSAFQHLAKRLEDLNIKILDLHKPLLEKLDGKSFCSILIRPKSCRGHFTEEGNRLVAESVFVVINKFKFKK